jgi:hypothetical protein
MVPLEISAHVDRVLAIPLTVKNPGDTPLAVKFSVKSPEGWKVAAVAPATVPPHSLYYLRVQATAPATKAPGWQEFSIAGEAGGSSIGTVSIRAELSTGWVAPQ